MNVVERSWITWLVRIILAADGRHHCGAPLMEPGYYCPACDVAAVAGDIGSFRDAASEGRQA